jgi:alpha-beta hydrolase superfamily lysophospholipase
MIVPEHDHLVSPEAQIKVCGYMPSCEAKRYMDAHHDVLREKNEILEHLWQDVDAFFNKHLGV